METKMEEFVNESRPLNMTGGWDEQVNGRADAAEEARKQQAAWAEEERTRRLAEEARKRQAAWEEEQRAKVRAQKRARWISFWILFGLAMILAGGIAMNYVEGFPFPMAVGLAILGVAAYMFTLGWIIGHKAR